jgi:hypothetical protein
MAHPYLYAGTALSPCGVLILSHSHRRWAQGGAAAPPTVELPRQPHRLHRRWLLPPLRRRLLPLPVGRWWTRCGARLDDSSLLHLSFPSLEIFRTIPVWYDLVRALLNTNLDGSPLVRATSMVAPSCTVLEAEALLGVNRCGLRSIDGGSRPSSVGLLSATSDDGNGMDRGIWWWLEAERCGSTPSRGGSRPSGCGPPPLRTATATTAYPDGGSFSVRTATAAPPSQCAPVTDVVGGSASGSGSIFLFLKIDFRWQQPILINNDFSYRVNSISYSIDMKNVLPADTINAFCSSVSHGRGVRVRRLQWARPPGLYHGDIFSGLGHDDVFDGLGHDGSSPPSP